MSMSSYLFGVGFFVISCVLGESGQQSTELTGKEHKRLQGTWHLVRSNIDGKEQPLPKEGIELVIKNNRFKMTMGAKLTDEGTFVMDPSKSPKTIDITHFSQVFGDHKIGLGIYEFKDQELWLCVARAGEIERPVDFSPKKE